MAYVYIHRKLDTHKVFYVGMSKSKSGYFRASTIHSRNKLWRNIVDKHGFYFEILKDNISVEEAFELENFIIQEYGRRDLKNGFLCNMSDGGEGNLNYIPTKENCEKHSIRMKGKINPFYGKKHSKETKKKISNKAKKRFKNKENHPLYGKKYTYQERDVFRGERPNIKGGKNPNAKKVINTYTKEIFSTIQDAADSIKISNVNLGIWLKNKDINPTNFLFLKDYNNELFIPKRRLNIYKIKRLEDDYIFSSMTELMSVTKLSRNKLLEKLNKNNLQGFKFVIKYE